MHKSRLAGFIIDCRTDDLEKAARFWSQALGYPLKDSSSPEDTGYRLARALHQAEPALAAKLDQARETTAANTAAAAPDPALIHPGVTRFLKEIGALR